MAYILLDRALYDWRRRRVERVHDWLETAGRAASPQERAHLIEENLRRLPRTTLESIAADVASPEWMAEPFADYLVRTSGIERWIRYARSHRREGDKWRRAAALRVLSLVHYDGILPLLENALADSDQDVVGAAVVILGGMGTKEAATLLVQALERGLHPASRIATHLDRFELPIADQLFPLLTAPGLTVRFWGATLLSRYPQVEGLDERIMELTDDPEPLVRKAAVETLGLIGGERAAATALKLLEDPVWYVRAHAARALGELGRRETARSVASLLADREWWVRAAAKEALLTMGDGVLDALVPFLDHPDRFARNGAAEVLQNLEWLDRIVEEVAGGDPEPKKLEFLRKIGKAGGARLVQSLVWRARDLPRLQQVLESLGLEPAGGR